MKFFECYASRVWLFCSITNVKLVSSREEDIVVHISVADEQGDMKIMKSARLTRS